MGKCLLEKELWLIRHACETKPIRARGQESVGQAPPYPCAKQSQFPGGAGRAGPRRAKCAKRTQFRKKSGGDAQPTKRRRLLRAKRAKRTQFPAPSGGARGNRAKQTQFPAAAAVETAQHSSPMSIVRHRFDAPPRETKPIRTRGQESGASPTLRMRQTNPIGPGRQASRGSSGRKMRNKPNPSIADCGLRIADSDRPAARRLGLCEPVVQTKPIYPLEGVGRGRPTYEEQSGELCETKPISGLAGRGEAQGTGDEGQMRKTKPIPRLRIADRAKQTQLDPAMARPASPGG
jgi:hypothetical protein